jgi:hypothetical protein
MLIFTEGRKPEIPEKPLEAREKTTQLTYDAEPGHIGERRAPSPLRHPCFQRKGVEVLTQFLCQYFAKEIFIAWLLLSASDYTTAMSRDV